MTRPGQSEHFTPLVIEIDVNLDLWPKAGQWGAFLGTFAETARKMAHSKGVSERIGLDPELLAAIFATQRGEGL